MKLTVLTENCAGGHLQAEHGLSYLIDTGETKILFDTGHSDLFLSNAKKLGIDLETSVSTVVLSHGHWDHGDGLRYLAQKRLVTHPRAFIKRFRKGFSENIGLVMSKEEFEERYTLITSAQPYRITEKIIYLGEIPRETEFEAKTTPFVDESGEPDFIPDDSGVAVITEGGIIVISGCAHAGICNTLLHAKRVTGIDSVKAVIGGFHLRSDNRQTRETIKFLKRESIETIIPSHCTALPALALFHKEFGSIHLQTGMVLTL